MILAWIILIPIVAGLLGCLLGRRSHAWPRGLAMAAMAIDLALVTLLWADQVALYPSWPAVRLTSDLHWPWVPTLGIAVRLSADGLSTSLVALTALLGLIAVGVSWRTIRYRVGFFHLNLMLVLSGVLGVFLAADLFLFYFFWELMLVPMYFLIAVWGHEDSHRAAVKFFLFTQAGGLAMLLAILGLYVAHGRATGEYTFELQALLATALNPTAATWIVMGLLVGFAVKLPAVPFHTWLPEAHTQAPTAGSLVLAGLLLKTGAYGLLRLVVPLLPQAAGQLAVIMATCGVAGILYGAGLAFVQTDLKRLVAYTSVSHMGFVLLGAAVGAPTALRGAVMQMLCHGLSTGALFILAGALQDRLNTRDLARMGGLQASVPRMTAMATFFALASMALPGLGNFVAEFLVLLGTYRQSVVLAAVAALGLIAAAIYALRMIDRVFRGPPRQAIAVADLRTGEMGLLVPLAVGLLWLGLLPQAVLNLAGPALDSLHKYAPASVMTAADESVWSPKQAMAAENLEVPARGEANDESR